MFFLSGFLFMATMVFSYSIYNNNFKYNFYSAVLMRFFFNIFSFWILGKAAVIGYSGIMKMILENKIIIYLGKISYGLYLYHFFVMWIVSNLLVKYNLNYSLALKAIIYTIVSILISSLSWYLIESPINKLKNNFKYNQ